MEELFTKVIDILYLAKQNDVEVILNGDRLQLKVPENKTIDEQLINEIRVNKQAIIDFLTHHNLNNSGNTAQYDKITTFDRNTVSLIPVSFSQERIWFIDQLEGSLQYHLPAVLLLEGDLDIDALERTFATIVNRHEVLRTVIRETGGQSYQHIKAADGWKLSTELSGNYTDGTSRLKDHISALIEQPFDLSADDMLRAHVIKLDNGAHILVITMHHIAADAWSMPVLVNEISTLYKAFANKETPVLQPLPLQFADYALWQRNTLGEEQLYQKLHYWETKLQDVAPLQLPADNVRPVNGSTRGVTIDFNIDNDITKAVQQLGRVNGATLYMTLLAAFKVLLYRYTGQEDICVGTSIAGRPQRELEGLIGFFVNTLALRDEVKGEHTFTELLAQVKQTTLEAYAHQDVPFERVVEATVKEREVGVSPLFQVMLVLGNTPQVPELKLGDLKLTGYEYEHKTVKFDLTIFVTETAQGLKCAIQYSTDLYNTPRIEQLITHFKTLLSAIAASPDVAIGKLQLITNAEEHWLLAQAHSECSYPADETIVNLFNTQALNHPTAQAVVFEGRSLTYQELNTHVNQLAHHLQRRGVKGGTLVPLFIERGVEMIVAILGILKAGGAYVPVDTDFPADRVKYMLEDTGAALVISSSRYADKLPDTAQNLKVLELDELDFELSLESESDPEILPLPEHLAYMIYTSGSTGRPKGVLIDHANITDYIFGLNELTAIGGCRTFGLLSTIATDLGNTVLFSSLAYGRTLHIFAKETVSNIHTLHSYFDEHRIDCIKIVPSHWKALSPENDTPLLPAKLIVFGGEALSSGSVNHIRRYSDCRIINHYGPTETTVGKLLYEVTDEPSGNNIIPIGRPFSNTVVYVLSKQLQLCPAGVPGELYIGGSGLSRGYHQQEKLTEEKFIHNPFGPEGALMYQTGDCVVMNADGNIEYIGRVDDQVKIRGYRVEPGEVSRVIQESDYVNQAVVIVRDDKQGNKQLAAYIVPSAQFDADLLHVYLKEHLPEYMIPAYITELEAIPLTANGKIDRKALPDPENTSPVSGYIAPRNEEEQQMADIWQRILDMDKVGVTDDFFRLGGHSLLAVRLIAEVRKAFKLELPISEIFDHPTVELLTIRLAQQQVSVLPPITVQERPKLIPLSYSQERLWFIDRMEGSLQYHVPAILHLTGPVNVAALNAAFSTIVDRHEVLRTVIYEQEGQGYQLVKPANNWALKQTSAEDLNGYSVEEYIKEQVAQPFDLSADDMLRVELVKITDDAHTLILTMHHIASDGSSGAILVKELIEIYNALTAKREPVLATLPVQYADYAIWQRAYLQGELLATRLDYWKEKLTGVATLQLPADHMRPSVQTTNGALHEFTIGSQLSQKVQEFSHENNVTLYMTLLAAFKVLLYRYSGQEDICVGTPVANRNQHEVDGLIGFFVNTLALRSGVNSNMTFANLLSKVKQTTLQAYEYQDVPFEKVVEAVVRERDQSRSPLFQVMFVLQNTPTIPVLQLGEMTLQQNAAGHDTAKFDITLFVIESANGLRCGLEYNTDIYDATTMGRMASHYEKLLNAAVNNPAELLGQLDMIDDAEQQLLTAFNNTAVDYPKNETIIDLFEAQAAHTPNTTAVVIDGEQIIYADLNKRANQLARYLQKQGITSGALVPLCIERSIDMIIGILAVLKAGGAYLPVDPQFPQERIDYMLADSGASIVLTSIQSSVHVANSEVFAIEINGRDKQAIAAENNTDLHTGINAEQLTYVLYTSGSTGKPKGVMMPQGNLYNLLKWQDSQFKNKNRKVLQFAAYTFDVSFQEIFSTICFGSTLYLIDGDKRKDVNELVARINKYGITHLFFPFVVLQNLAEYVAEGSGNMPSVEEIIIAGEQLKITDEVRALTCKTGAVIINQYGPTEAHVVSSYIVDIDSSGVLPPIGIPVGNTQIHIESEKGVLSPVGIYGEICIGGVQVARGYLNQPELTAEKFVADPYSSSANTRMYKTGDIGRWLADGNIEYLGRKDDQVKIRGYRVELGEIESVLLQSGLVQQAVVLARADDQGIKRLIAYVTTDDEYDRDELQSYLKSRLPEYMVPRLWVQLESFPLTPNGKIDKRALPEAELSAQITETYVAPRNEVEEKLASIWQQLLGIDKAGIHDNFFELGGHSLLGMRVISHFRREHGGELTIRDLFAYPTIAELAEQVQKATIAIPAITAEERPQYIPLSYSQERLWFIDQLEGSAPYHLPATLRLSGKPDVQALEASFRHIVDRHEVLRTVIREHEGQSYQLIFPAGNWQLKETAIQGNLNSYISEAVKKPFDLSKDLMLRAELINAGEEGYILLLVMHHIASDGWSTPILVKEFMTLYAGYADHKEVILPQLAVQYADYAIWQRNYLQGSVLETRLNYWKEKLSGVSTLQLATDHIRPAVQSSNGAVYLFTIGKEETSKLQTLGKQEGATLYMTLLSIFKVLLYRYSGQQDICVGSPVANRDQAEVSDLIGFFVNTLALRSTVAGEDTFSNLLQQVKQTTLEAYEHQDVPFEKVVEVVVKDRDQSRSPLFQVLFVLQNTPALPALQLGDISITAADLTEHTAKYDISFNLLETENGIRCIVEYNTDLYEEATIAGMAGHYTQLVQSVLSEPGAVINDLTILDEAEETLLRSFNNTIAEYPQEQNIISLFEAQAAETPDATALIFEQESLSYKELNEHSNQLAHYLQKAGVSKESLVPVCMERGIAMMVSILAILKAGGAYVPVDMEYPQERIAYILADTKAGVVLCTQKNKTKLNKITNAPISIIETDAAEAELIAIENVANLNTDIKPNQLAYIIYTSGSTGKPKGVMVEHGNVVSLVKNAGYVTPGSDDTLLVTGSPAFDATTFEYWSMLLNGGRLILSGDSELLNSSSLKTLINNQGVNIMWYTSSWFNQLTEDSPEVFAGLTRLLVGGEKLSPPHIKKIRAMYPELQLINGYGPTENTTFSLTWPIAELNEEGLIPIGYPLNNRTAYVLDAAGNLCPVGVPGEICLGGAGVARGYLNQPELTTEKFIADTYGETPNARLYKTGDIGRWLTDGTIEYLGRKDDQVKIRGYRIELGEIENVLLQSGLVQQAVVLARADQQGNKKLVAYVSINQEQETAALQQYLQSRLPEYMVPRQWVEMESFPLTPNGKIDKHALPDAELVDQMTVYVAPRTETEAQLVAIWQELLGIEKVGIHDNFFELGGHSLLGMRVLSHFRREYGGELTIRDVFTYPTIAELGNQVPATTTAGTAAISIQERPAYIPLSYSQERLWFIDRLEGSVAYHVPALLRLSDMPDIAALTAALGGIVNRHEVLRTVIKEHEGQGYQQVMPEGNWQLKETQIEGDLKNYISEAVQTPFDLSKDAMLRAELISTATDKYLLLVMHHIASDGWSMPVLVKEFIALYAACQNGTAATLTQLPVQYADYAVWQRNTLQGKVLENKLNYWIEKLSGVGVLQLPADHIRPAIQSSHGAVYEFSISNKIKKQLQAISLNNGASLYMTLLSVFKVLLYRYSGQQDICVGSPVANREQAEVAELIGFFVNTLALRSTVNADMSFTELLSTVKQTTLEAYEHQDVPFEKVVEAVVKERDAGRSPLFQVLFVLQNTQAIPGLRLGDITAEPIALPTQTAKYDLSLNIHETVDGLRCIMEYNTDLYEEETISRMAGHFGKLLVSVSGSQDDKVSDLSMLDATEQRLLEKFNDTAAIYPKESNIVNLFEAQVSTTPNATAMIVDGETISYKELNERANQLARYLQRAGVTTETLVPVCMERDIAMLVSILAVLKAGGAYVPVDMDYPAARISYMLTDTAAQVVLCSKNSKNKLSDSLNRQTLIVIDGEHQAAISAESSSAIDTAIKPDQLAYVIYTSGSTGTPKGVMVEHGNANAFIAWCISEFAGYDIDTVYASTSVCFDLSVFEMFYTLSTGKTIRLLTNGLAIKNYLPVDKNVLINTVPSVMESLLAEGVDLSNATVINMAGEPVPLHVLKGLDTDNIAVRNLYGPTEDTTYSTCYVLDKNLPVLIGKPIANSRAYIITQDNKEINPVGVPGEICIGGAGVTRGYLNKPELTNEKFIKDIYSSEPNARMYKTGDIGRWLPDGNIEYLGRKDDQVKVRGYRIELGEIENALAESGLIKQAVVLAREDKNGNKRLVAYITTTGVYNKEALQQHLGQHLPEYMVPRLWVQLENFPVTTNGKIDKRALPDAEPTGETEGYVEPRNPAELKLAEIWQELLGIEKVGVYDNFFELGGDSILTIQVVSRARKAGIEIQPKDIFIHQAIASLADSIQKAEAGNIKTEQGLLSGEVGLLPIQQWYLQRDEEQISHYNQSVLFKIDKSIKADDLQNCIDVLTVHHDALRLKYVKVNNQWQQEYGTEQPKLITEDLTGISQENLATIIGECAQKHQRSLSITDGKLMRVVLMDTPDHETANRLYIVVHHLAIDGVSWRIILEDLNNLLDGMMTGLQLDMDPKSSSYRQWQLALQQYSTSRKLQLQEKYWEQIAADYHPLPQDTSYQGNVTVEDMISFKVKLDATRTQQLLQDIPKVYHTEINDMLLAALGDTLCKWTGKDKVVIGLEGHGREQISNDIDISRTVGWFTSLYPVLLTSAINDDVLIKQVKESLRKIEDKGIGFGVLKYMNKSVNLQGADSWDLIFNYLGQLNTTANPGKWLSRADEDSGASVSEKQTSPSKIAINSYVVDGQLIMHWSYSGIHFNAATINNIAGQYLTCLTQLIDHCLEEGRSRVIFTPADYGLSAEVNYEELDKFLGEDNNDNIMSF